MSGVWGYTKGCGPDTWAEKFPLAGGAKQSPVDIDTKAVEADSSLTPVNVAYDPQNCQVLLNTGHGLKVEVRGCESSFLEDLWNLLSCWRPCGDLVRDCCGVRAVSGGPLDSTYRLEQFHFHWGRSCKTGSEHTVNGNLYPAELHLVHWNTALYSSFGEAAQGNKGLTVLGILLEVGTEHEELKKLTDLIDCVKHMGQECPLGDGFNLQTFLPDNRSYWTYEGSLTTPPFYESVTWIVFKTPIQISETQVEKFRELLSYRDDETCPVDEFDGRILENYRPTVPLQGRVVRSYDE